MTAEIHEFAVLGGRPAFAEPVHVGAPNLGDRRVFMKRIRRILDSGRLTNGGPYVQELEARVAAHLGVRHCVLVSSGTSALQIAARAAGVTGEVIMPSFTFVGTAHALAWIGARPVFCDVDPETHCLDPARVEELFTERTAAIIGVHLWGRPCDVDGLAAIADRLEIPLLLDAAQAFDSAHRGRPIGGFGTAEVLSFHATKFVNCLEGGAVVTDDDDLAERARLLRNFGFADYDRVTALGTNAKLNEVSAAAGLTSLEALPRFRAANEENAAVYAERLADVAGLSLMDYPAADRSNRHYVIAELDGTRLTRDELHRTLWAENILARRYFTPGAHRCEPYRSQADAHADLRHSERLSETVLALPTGTAVDPADVGRICDVIRRALEAGPALSARLAG